MAIIPQEKKRKKRGRDLVIVQYMWKRDETPWNQPIFIRTFSVRALPVCICTELEGCSLHRQCSWPDLGWRWSHSGDDYHVLKPFLRKLAGCQITFKHIFLFDFMRYFHNNAVLSFVSTVNIIFTFMLIFKLQN